MSTAHLLYVMSITSLYFFSVKADCSSPPLEVDNASHNISSSPPFPEETVARFTCDDGYTFDGNTIYSKCSNSQWSISGEISCRQVFCGHVETPQNGYLVNSPTYEVGTFMKFGCNEGHGMNGVSSLFCRSDGEWRPNSAPTCNIKDCGEFGDVVNGGTFQDNSNVERNKYGSIVHVTCNRGYVLNGQSEVRCQANGEWEPKPTCEATSCDPYPGLNSQCVKDSSFSNNLLFFVCKDNYNVSGLKQGPSYARCSNNVWDNTEMTCLCNCKIHAFSSNLVAISNLNEKNFLVHGHDLDWSCSGSAVKTMSIDEAIVCDDGELKMRTPDGETAVNNLSDTDLCTLTTAKNINNDAKVNNSQVKADCFSSPPEVDHASHNISSSPPFPEETVARFTCDDGYTFDGNTIYSKCSNSQWSISGEISCRQVFCGHVETPQNGYLVNSPTYEVGTFMKFGCNEGHGMNGVSSLFCRTDGEWRPNSAPTCNIKDCGEFGDVVNGETFQDNSNVERNKYESVVQVTCNPGYVLNGKSEVRCQANGEWELKPTCKMTSCDPYPGLNGQCVKDFSFSNNLLFFVCKDDYNVSGLKQGPSYARCSNNEWDNTEMACLCNCKIHVFSSNLVAISNLNEKNFLVHGHDLDWSCSGSAVKTVSMDEKIVCDDGELKMRTPDGESPVNNLSDTDLCTWKTARNLNNDAKVNNSQDFVSVKANCSSFPPEVDHASHNISSSPPFPEETVARFTCDDGYTFDGNTIYSKCSNSQWSISGEISCRQVFCGHVETPQNGYLVNSPTYEVGTFMKFGCNEGHGMNGVSSLFCRTDGEWRPNSAPTCNIKDCGEFGDVVNGETFQDNSNVERNKYESVVQVNCNPGYVLNGKSEVRCQANGEWEPKPTCEITSCDPYPGLNGQCVKDFSFSNNLLFFDCKDDYNLFGLKQGPSYARCSNNEWDNTEMACLCNCKIPVFSSNLVAISNLNEKNFLFHGHDLDWSCSGSSVKTVSIDEKIVCDDGELKMRTPDGESPVSNLSDTDLCSLTIARNLNNNAKVKNSQGGVRVNILVMLIFLFHIFLSI